MASDDQHALQEGFMYLNRYYKVYGIIYMVVVVIYGLAIVFGVLGALFAGL